MIVGLLERVGSGFWNDFLAELVGDEEVGWENCVERICTLFGIIPGSRDKNFPRLPKLQRNWYSIHKLLRLSWSLKEKRHMISIEEILKKILRKTALWIFDCGTWGLSIKVREINKENWTEIILPNVNLEKT